MSRKPSLEESHAIIRQAMKDKGVTYLSLAPIVQLRSEKMANAVRVSTGVTPTTIMTRKRVAEALGLDPFEVWSEEYLNYAGRKSYDSRPYKVDKASQMSKQDYEEMPPRMRVRALCKDKRIDLNYLQEKFKVTYRVLTAAIYGAPGAHELRKKIAAELNTEMSEIWPDLYSPSVIPSDYMIRNAAEDSDLDNFFGMGNMM